MRSDSLRSWLLFSKDILPIPAFTDQMLFRGRLLGECCSMKTRRICSGATSPGRRVFILTRLSSLRLIAIFCADNYTGFRHHTNLYMFFPSTLMKFFIIGQSILGSSSRLTHSQQSLFSKSQGSRPIVQRLLVTMSSSGGDSR